MKIVGARIRNIHSLCNFMESQQEQGKSALQINIPHYQRPYEWADPEKIKDAGGKNLIVDLFDDFFDNYNNENIKDKTYFMGMIVGVKNADDEKSINIIDGQQRLTTIYLLNVIGFICKLRYIHSLFENKKVRLYQDALNDFCDFYVNNISLANSDKIDEYKISVKSETESSKEDEEISDILYSKFKCIFPIDISNKENYEKSFKSFLAEKKLSLNYDYDEYNKILKSVISRTYIFMSDDKLEMEVDIDTSDNIEIKEIKEPYVNAMKLAFSQIRKYMGNNEENCSKWQIAIETISKITDNLMVCLLLAENDEDAYALFEVVNDRNLPPNTMDLIKNLFYQKYVQTKSDDKDKINSNISALNKIWNESLAKLYKYQRTFVLLIAISYITKNENVSMKNIKTYKEAVAKYLKSKSTYTYEDIERDFNIIRDSLCLCKQFYDNKIISKGSAELSLNAEIKSNTHLFYKLYHMLRALTLDDVIPALTNILLDEYYQKSKKEELSIEGFFNTLKTGELQNDSVDKVAKELNILTLYGKDYTQVRKFARDKVNNHLTSLSSELHKETEKEFTNDEYNGWIDRWKKGTNDLKVKVLFNRLFSKTKSENGEIKDNKKINCFLKAKDQELDHLDANTLPKDEASKAMYYNPDDINRNEILNSLGNMMVLDKSFNIQKSNNHLEWSLKEYYEKYVDGSGKPHWIISEIKSLLDQYNNTICVGDKNVKVPTIDFFNERKKLLIKYFKQVIEQSQLI